MKNRFYLIMALVLALALSGGAYAYAFTTAGGTIGIAEPTADVATSNATETQPDWNSVLDDLASDNKTCGEVPNGSLFDITPNATYSGDLVASVYLANSADLTKAYRYLNMKLYLSGSEEAEETPNYRMLTLPNGEATFTMKELQPVAGTWTETTQSDFADSTLNQVDVISPGDVILDTFSDNVTDTFDDATKIATSDNVTVSGGQVRLTQGVGGTTTLRPNANGDLVEFEDLIGAPTHWEAVDEVVADDATTHVGSDVAGRTDLFQLTDSGLATGTPINSVTVYERVRREGGGDNDWQIVIKSGTTSAYSPTFNNEGAAWAERSYQWTTDPNTGEAWTVAAVDALQAGAYVVTGVDVTQVYVEVDYSGIYNTKGWITSINLLSGESVVSIDSFDYNASAIPSGTGLKVQFSQDNTNWYNSAGTGGGWDTLSQGTHNIDLSGLGWSGANFYYHMEFTSDGSGTPILDEISVNFSTYYTSGDLTSSTYDTGYDLNWDWDTISFTVNEPSATDIKFQIRTASTEAGLSSATWYGPASTSDYYQVSGTAINSVHDGDRWIQYKAYFSDTGTSTPTLSDVSITYSGQAVAFTIEVTGGGYCLVSDNTSEWGAGWTVTPELYCQITQR